MSDAGRFLAQHPTLEEQMRRSAAFEPVKRAAALEIDGETLYIVRGDTLGSEEDLFVEAIVRGAQRDDPDDPTRKVYLELDDEQRALVDERIETRAGGPAQGRPASGGRKGARA